jgi:hypothetical protein
MALENELDMVAPRIAGGTVVPVGTYFNAKNMCIKACSASETLPALDWWHKISTASSTALDTAATNLNALLNGPAPGLSAQTGTAYAYTSGSLSTYTSSMLPSAGKGQGACDA